MYLGKCFLIREQIAAFMDHIAQHAFELLYPEKRKVYSFTVNRSNRFKPYGANITKRGTSIEIGLSNSWNSVDEHIVLGLMQELLMKVFHERKESINVDLYNHFVKRMHTAIEKVSIDPDLKRSFDRVNRRYFDEAVELPNLEWGRGSYSKLGSYEFTTDTIIISSIFRGRWHFVDYIMHHEMLHKHLKFKTSDLGRARHHTRQFRLLEKRFEEADMIEKEIESFIRTMKRAKGRDIVSILRDFF